MIRVESIRKVFNPHSRNANEVLKGVSFELPDKGLVAIFGKSGSGKTTLLNIIGGLDKQDSGKIYIDNEDTTGKVDHIRNAKIGFIFQNYYLENGYTIEEIMRNAMLIAGFNDEKEIKRRTLEVLKLVKMDRYKHKTADALSGGQKQRVAIARALIKGSDIILADEPTGNLDAENTTIIMDILKEISKTQLVVLVTHEVNLIHKYADSHIKLIDGELNKDAELEKEIEIEAEKNNIYVSKDNKRTYNIDSTNIDVYGEDISKSDIQIIGDNGSVYLKAGEGVKIIDNKSEKQIIFDDVVKQEEKITLDVPKFSKSVAKKNGRLFKLKNILSSKHLNSEDRAYSTGNIFKNIFICAMAIVLSFFAMFTFEAVNTKPVNKQLDSNSVFIDMREYNEIKRFKPEIYNSIDFFALNYSEGSFGYANQQSMDAIVTKYAPKSLSTNAEKNHVVLESGEMPKDKEVLITRGLAETLKHDLRQDEYQTDEAIKLLTFDKQYKISGIVEGNEPLVYMNRADYVNYLAIYSQVKIVDSTHMFFEPKYLNSETFATINSYSAEICLYDGETLDLKDEEVVIEINRSSTYLMMDNVEEADYKIDTVNRVLLKTPEFMGIENSYPMYIRQFSLNRKEMSTDLRIYVTEKALENIFVYIKPNLDALSKNTSYFFEVNTTGSEQMALLNERLTERAIDKQDINALYDFQNKEINNSIVSKLMIFVVAEILMFIIYFFIEKSGSIKNSKEYGIFRAIGVNKSNLLYKEFVLTLKNNMIIYSIIYIISLIIMSVRYNMMNIELGEYIGISIGMMLLGSLIMMVISIIPYMFVLFKTPSEILSKYDI